MANAHGPGTTASDAARSRGRRTIPTSPGGAPYTDELDRYLDRLLDEALEETFPASDSPAVPTRRDLEKK